jgi:hypothetical protein
MAALSRASKCSRTIRVRSASNAQDALPLNLIWSFEATSNCQRLTGLNKKYLGSGNGIAHTKFLGNRY